MILKTILSNLWDAAKAMLRGKFITSNAYLRKEERLKSNEISYVIKKLEKKKKEQINLPSPH